MNEQKLWRNGQQGMTFIMFSWCFPPALRGAKRIMNNRRPRSAIHGYSRPATFLFGDFSCARSTFFPDVPHDLRKRSSPCHGYRFAGRGIMVEVPGTGGWLARWHAALAHPGRPAQSRCGGGKAVKKSCQLFFTFFTFRRQSKKKLGQFF